MHEVRDIFGFGETIELQIAGSWVVIPLCILKGNNFKPARKEKLSFYPFTWGANITRAKFTETTSHKGMSLKRVVCFHKRKTIFQHRRHRQPVQ